MISLYDRVKIKSNGITGIVVDISVRKGITWYIVESDSKYPLGDSKGNEETNLWTVFSYP